MACTLFTNELSGLKSPLCDEMRLGAGNFTDSAIDLKSPVPFY